MIKIKFISILLFVSILSNAALAQNAEDIIKYRMNIMKALGNHISIIAANLKGKVSMPEDILPHSKSMLLTLSAINIDKLFPTNKDDGLEREVINYQRNEKTIHCISRRDYSTDNQKFQNFFRK